MKEIKERVTLDLLPQAFTTKKRTFALLAGEYLIIDSSSAARADVMLTALGKALEMPLAQLRTVISTATAMNNWLLSGECPAGFTVDRDCELRDSSEEKATVRYVHHDLEGDEIRAHIAAGKSATRLGITWSDRISFVLTDQFQIKRLAFLDILKEEAEQQAETMAELFDADMTIMAGELSRMIADLTTELGGIIRPEPDLIDGEATP
jgi:recombination associated protein RdgC